MLFKLDCMARCGGQLITESQEKSGYFFFNISVLVGQEKITYFQKIGREQVNIFNSITDSCLRARNSSSHIY